jgi:N-acetylglutamate synthase-like GNAT family acetyltransferase
VLFDFFVCCTQENLNKKSHKAKNMKDIEILDLTPDNFVDYGVCGYKDAKKHIELRKKIEWFKKYYPKGLRIKILLHNKGGYQGMLEYIPGEYAHRPVNAKGFMFIHCIFVGFKKEHKGKGYASSLIKECIIDAKRAGMVGVAVVTRKGSFMVNKDIFIKVGFVVVDKADPDFELLALKFNQNSINPSFKNMEKQLEKYQKGLFILRSVQCPYTEKNVNAIIDSAKSKFNLDVSLVDLLDSSEVQTSPCAFGSFCIILDGEIISYHPISKVRFENILNKKLT